MINMDTDTVSLNQTEDPSMSLRRTRIKQNHSYTPEPRGENAQSRRWGGDRDLLSSLLLVCVRDDLKAEGSAGDEGSGIYGFADGLASGDGDRVGIGQQETKSTRMNEGRSENGLWLPGNARKRMERQAGPRLPAFRQGSALGIYTSSPGGRDNLRYAETLSTSRRWEKRRGKARVRALRATDRAGLYVKGVRCSD
jgi:hypothetical protein